MADAPKNNIRPLRMRCAFPNCDQLAETLAYDLEQRVDLSLCRHDANLLGIRGRPLPDIAMTREEMD